MDPLARRDDSRTPGGAGSPPWRVDPDSPAGRALAWPGRAFPRRVAVLGSTGTVGLAALEIVRGHPGAFEVDALAAGSRMRELAEQVREFRPRAVAVKDDRAREELASLVDLPREKIAVGAQGLAALAAEPRDVVLHAVSGAAGLPATLGAARAGTAIALANKESLVLAGELLRRESRASGAPILPVDSEHAGLFLCLAGAHRGAPSEGMQPLTRLVLTASGGPLRTRADWADATPEEVLAHPVWRMGARITVDSALLLNKGFEVLEASHLFGVPLAAMDVVIHPQAVVHALIEFEDHSMLAQLSVPDMKLPVQLAMSWPARLAPPLPALDFAALRRLDFEPLAPGRYPAFATALAAAKQGGTAPATLNAADEVAVAAFLDGRLRLGDVPEVLDEVLAACPVGEAGSLAAIEAADRAARDEAARALERRGARVHDGRG
jgi:1-deoxy-D-xylulose-5-phosphate reductoisomerase